MTVVDTSTRLASDYVAGQLRAEAARQSIKPAELARRMGKEHTWVSRRMAGRFIIALDEIPLFAAELGVPISYFLPPDWLTP